EFVFKSDPINLRPFEGETRKVVMPFKVLLGNTFNHGSAVVFNRNAHVWLVIGPFRSMLPGSQLAFDDAPVFRVDIDAHYRRAVPNATRYSHSGDYRHLGRRRVRLDLRLPARFQ